MMRYHSHHNDPTDTHGGNAPECSMRNARVQADHISILHGRDGRVVVKLKSEGLLIDTYNSAYKGSAIL